MSSDFLQFNKFITESHKAFEEYSNEISSYTDVPLETAREEYGMGRRMIESCKDKVHNVLSSFFQEIETSLNSHFKSFENNIEGPKQKAMGEMDHYKSVLKSLQTGDIQDQNQVSKDVLELWRAFQPNETNPFALKADLLPNKPSEVAQKEESLRLFKEDNKRIRSCLEKVEDWLKAKPSLEDLKSKKGSKQQLPPSSMVTRGKSSVGKVTVGKIPNAFPPSNMSKKHEPSFEANEDMMRLSGSLPSKKLKVSSEIKDYGRPTVKQTPLKNSVGKISHMRSHEDLKLDGLILNEKMASSVIIGKPGTVRKSFLTVCSRFILDINHQEKFVPGEVLALTFSADRELTLLGFGQYLIARGSNSGSMEYCLLSGDSIDEEGVDMSGKSNVLSKGNVKLLKAEKDPRITQVMFESQVKLNKGRFYTIKLTNKSKDPEICLWRGTNGNDKKIPFSFSVTQAPDSSKQQQPRLKNNIKKGQIPELYYTS